MPESRAKVRLDMNPHERAAQASTEIDPGTPFKILVVGDFSGRNSRDAHEPDSVGTRKLHAIDRDDFEQVLATLAPEVRIRLGESGGIPTTVTLSELDDLHPDALYRNADVFDSLRDLRRRLLDDATSRDAIAELAGAVPDAAPEPEAPPEQQPAQQPETQPDADGGSLLDFAVEATEAQDPAAGSTGNRLVDDVIRELVAPHMLPRPDPRQADLVADVERATSEQMRALLRAPEFRAVESAWRALDLLVHRLETDGRMQIRLLDASRAELDAGAGAAGFRKHVVERTVETAGGEPFSVMILAFEFDGSDADAVTLDRLGAIALAGGAPFVAAAAPSIVGAEGFWIGSDPDDWGEPRTSDTWDLLRTREHARSIALVAPRYLSRMPYGPTTSPTECFPFEEEGPEPEHEDLLWANGAFLVGYLLARTWREVGPTMRAGQLDRVDGLPVHVRSIDGESVAVPCAEVELPKRGAERLATQGIIPLCSVRGADSIEVGTIRSLSISEPTLAGRWTQ